MIDYPVVFHVVVTVSEVAAGFGLKNLGDRGARSWYAVDRRNQSLGCLSVTMVCRRQSRWRNTWAGKSGARSQ